MIEKEALILGIDPGLQHTGWGVISVSSNRISFVASGVISTNAKHDILGRLRVIHDGLLRVAEIYKPTEAAIEETFVNKNSATSLKLGQARGAILLTLSLAGLEMGEYSANLVKKSVVGNGHADKNQVAMMVKTLLPASSAEKADASDALAVAICHAHLREFLQKIPSP